MMIFSTRRETARALMIGLTFLACATISSIAQETSELVIAKEGKSSAQIIVAPGVGEELVEDGLKKVAEGNWWVTSDMDAPEKLVRHPWEMLAAQDLAKYIGMMSGAAVPIRSTPEAVAAAQKAKTPILFVGQAALQAKPALRDALAKAAKKNPWILSDAVVVQREGNRVYIAGKNDGAHYFAAAWLLQNWGCRWYLPTEFGECIPDKSVLSVGKVNFAYAPPFELRLYWLAWGGNTSGINMFQRRNFMHNTFPVSAAHNLSAYQKDLIPEGGSAFHVPIAENATAEYVAKQIAPLYAVGEHISLSMEDGVYVSPSLVDKEIAAGFYDKYFLAPSLSDNFMTLYNNVARTLREKYPNSKSRLGIASYSNITLPPQRDMIAEKSLYTILSPIDFDPNHAMDDPRSPPRNEWREIVYRWGKVMPGRVSIYDYDQGMLAWRDIPNPSHMVFARDVKHYRRAGVLGFSTESRGAMATIWTNLFFRGQLMWNPDANVDELLNEWYPKFYGPAAAPMKAYWSAIYKAWDETLVTEHEYFAAPAIYTPQLVAQLKPKIEAAEKIIVPLQSKTNLSRNEKLVLERMKFTRLSFDMIESYVQMIQAAATDAEYSRAVQAGKRGVITRKALTQMNPTFTNSGEEALTGPAILPGEVEQYQDLQSHMDGTKGTLIQKLPLEWAFRRDPRDTGVASGFAYKPIDFSYWNANKNKYLFETRKDYPTTQWEMLRTDSYMQAQGILHPDWQSFTGFAWYRTDMKLNANEVAGDVHLRFPGIFNECWLYVNGNLVSHREQKPMWWQNSYSLEWDVDLSGELRAGNNTITVRQNIPHHFGGMFRRPFLYRMNKVFTP